MNKMRPRKTREQWSALIEQQRQSGLTILEFCQKYDIGFASFGSKRSNYHVLPNT